VPYDPAKHHRRSIRLRKYDYSQAGAYFVTLCTRDRECLFGDVVNEEMAFNEYGNAINETWIWLGEQYEYIMLDEYIVMPNHFHGILVIHEDGRGGSRTAPTYDPVKRKPLGRLIGAFKTVSTKRINEIRKTPGSVVWQRNYYEHIIRNQHDLHDIRQYILYNPLRWEEDESYPGRLRTL
jgi:REP element-mobilizing transposase RayT